MDEVTHDLFCNKRNLLFDFDNEDLVHREEFVKECVGLGIIFSLVTIINIRVLNSMKIANNMGPLRKFVLLNTLNLPFYFYFYHKITNKYMDLKKYMVKEYLLLGDEVLFKRKNNLNQSKNIS